MLFGRRTYEQFHGFWSAQTDGNPYTEVLNRKHKYVASRGALPWVNSSRIEGDVAAAVAALRREIAGDLVVLGSVVLGSVVPGSGELVRSLDAAGLVDVYRLSIHPRVCGCSPTARTGGCG